MLAPAMNVHMWRAEATRTAVEALRARGAVVVAPETGELACGDVGEGRLAGLDAIADGDHCRGERTRDLDGVRVLVTAGPTREPIDPVRFLEQRIERQDRLRDRRGGRAARRGGDARERSDDAAGSRSASIRSA